ncbi:glycosyltransferase family 4 protein [Pantanalinema rosaneae CENA516]|uniref:glycosyltransferase family 4 protein n=1 Tax=Pantanalinema rosaneae TaxID=1620701 RepID=UPI003D6E118F
MIGQITDKQLQQPAELGKQLRVLLVSENVSLRMSGETSVPYYYFKLLQERGVDVWMICHARNRAELREFFSAELFERIHFVEDSSFQAAVWRFSKRFPYRIEDLIFGRLLHIITQFHGRKLALDIIKKHQIDIIFEPSPISPKGLSFMYDMGVPVVIGPMCGGLNLPPAFRYMDSRFTRLSIFLGRCASWIGHRLVPGKLRADALLVGNQRTARVLPQGYQGKVYEVVESGVDLSRWEPKHYFPPNPDQPVRFVFCGRLVDWKGAQFLVEAFKTVAEQTNAVLEIIGDGELREEIAARVMELGLQNRVNLHGRLPLADCMALITNSDVYVMPSLRECGGLALLESMAIGLPIIAANWAGPAEYLNDRCGILVDPSSPSGFVQGLAEAMIRLAQSPHLRYQLGKGAQQRVKMNYFDWDSKTDRVLEVLKETLARV